MDKFYIWISKIPHTYNSRTGYFILVFFTICNENHFIVLRRIAMKLRSMQSWRRLFRLIPWDILDYFHLLTCRVVVIWCCPLLINKEIILVSFMGFKFLFDHISFSKMIFGQCPKDCFFHLPGFIACFWNIFLQFLRKHETNDTSFERFDHINKKSINAIVVFYFCKAFFLIVDKL